VTTAPKFQMIDPTDVAESELNPRKSFDESKLAELVLSVTERGVLEPILVRPTKKPGAPPFEVAAGARRLRAAIVAKLKHIPAMVRDMTDTELLEVALLENVVRHDISALEEGDAYRALVAQHGYTVEQLVTKTGKSRTVVFQRMKLGELQGGPREALAAGHVSASVAELIARLPTEKTQEAALAKLRKDCHWKHLGRDGNAYNDERVDISRMPFRDAKELLDEEFRLVLAKAPFDSKATDLVPAAGACGVCPKRTGADKEFFKDVKADTCLDGACWAQKSAASTRLLRAELTEHGKKLVKIGRLTDQYNRDRLAAPVAEKFSRPGEKVDGKSTWKELLGSETPTVVALDRENKTHNLVDKKAALELLKAKDAKAAAKVEAAMAEPRVDDWRARQAEELKRHAQQRRVDALIRAKALAEVTRLEDAIDLLFVAFGADRYYWERRAERAGLPKGAKADKLKPAQRVRVLVAEAMSGSGTGFAAVRPMLAKRLKLDLKALAKKAAETDALKCIGCNAGIDQGDAGICRGCGGEG